MKPIEDNNSPDSHHKQRIKDYVQQCILQAPITNEIRGETYFTSQSAQNEPNRLSFIFKQIIARNPNEGYTKTIKERRELARKVLADR